MAGVSVMVTLTLGERVNVTAEAGDMLNVRDCPAVKVPVDVEMPIISPQ